MRPNLWTNYYITRSQRHLLTAFENKQFVSPIYWFKNELARAHTRNTAHISKIDSDRKHK